MNEKSELIQTVEYDCPFCEQVHFVEIRKESTQCLIKEEPVDYEKTVYFCANENESFVPGKVMDENLLSAKNAFRKKHNLLTSDEIKNIRIKYGLTQKEFSFLLGWGEVTIMRYEIKLIQDETYDNLMRMVNQDPALALEFLDKHQIYFEKKRYLQIREILKKHLKELTSLFKEKEIKNMYMDFEEKSELNGYKQLDLNKVINILGFFASHLNDLFKVKLMKLLFYCDFLHYKKYNTSMTGLVYVHLPMGAVPIGYNELLYLPSIKFEENYFIKNHEECTAFHILPNNDYNIPLSAFNNNELAILTNVVSFFKEQNTPNIINYMHEENAYKKTAHNDIISYSFANEINDLIEK